MSRATWLSVLAIGMCSPLFAQETVWLAPAKPAQYESDWYARGIQKIRGKVQRFDAKQLRLLVQGGNQGDTEPSQFAAHRVLWIESDSLSEPEQSALRSFAAGEYEKSLRPLIDSLNSRPPVWRQQWISMMASIAAYQSSRHEIAAELVAQLDARPLPPLVLSWLPVDWTGNFPARDANADKLTSLQERLSHESAAVRLTVASWLLSTQVRDRAKATLEKLALDNQRPTIARLAETVLWRSSPPPAVRQNHERWLKKIDALPLVLQTGPTKTLIDRYKSSGMKKEAARLGMSLKANSLAPVLK